MGLALRPLCFLLGLVPGLYLDFTPVALKFFDRWKSLLEALGTFLWSEKDFLNAGPLPSEDMVVPDLFASTVSTNVGQRVSSIQDSIPVGEKRPHSFWLSDLEHMASDIMGLMACDRISITIKDPQSDTTQDTENWLQSPVIKCGSNSSSLSVHAQRKLQFLEDMIENRGDAALFLDCMFL